MTAELMRNTGRCGRPRKAKTDAPLAPERNHVLWICYRRKLLLTLRDRLL